MLRLYILVILSQAYISCSYKIVWDNDAIIDLNEIDDDLERSGEKRIPNWFFIYPGTKWCGAGNISENDNDLGTHRDTDKCCRTHDMCNDIIEGHQMNHGLKNPSPFTRLNCACDKEFYKCLKTVNTRTSKQIGQIYFTALGTQCYREDYPVTRCKKYTYFPTRKCVEYEYDTSGAKIWQWFDIPNF